MVACHWAVYLVIEYNPHWAPGALLPSLSWHWTDSGNRRTCQSFWYSVVALSSPRSLWYWIVAVFFFFFCVSFQPTFKSQKKEKDIQHRWEEDDFFFFPPFFPSAYLLRGVGEYVVIFSPTRNGKLLKGEDERREMACYKGTGTDRQHEPMRWQTWRVFEVFCPFFVLGHAWAKKIWGKWRELRGGKGGEACQTQALTGCLMCFMQVLYSGETDSGKKHCFLKTLHVCLAPNNRISND